MTPPKSKAKPHVFIADPDVPADPRIPDGRGACATCHLIGSPGDAHHTLPDRPATADARELAAGEGGDA